MTTVAPNVLEYEESGLVFYPSQCEAMRGVGANRRRASMRREAEDGLGGAERDGWCACLLLYRPIA